MRAESGLLKGLNPTMALVALVVVALFLIAGTAAPETSSAWFVMVRNGIVKYFKWYYILVVALFLLFSLWLLFSRFADLKLGDDDQEPEFGYLSWFAMLFGAGMGIGLVFWSIAEPMYHFQSSPFTTEPGTPAAAVTAMRLTYFHWGLHPWQSTRLSPCRCPSSAIARSCHWRSALPSIHSWEIAFTADGATPWTSSRSSAPSLALQPHWAWVSRRSTPA